MLNFTRAVEPWGRGITRLIDVAVERCDRGASLLVGAKMSASIFGTKLLVV